LPSSIAGTGIRLMAPEQVEKKLKDRPTAYYINLLGWEDEEKAECIFVSFSNGFTHQFDFFISYRYDPARKRFEEDTSRFENYLFVKIPEGTLTGSSELPSAVIRNSRPAS
jgi:hypothetical protein